MRGSSFQAGLPNRATQLLGGWPPGFPSLQMYQSRLGDVREDLESTNHLCWSEVWFTTRSRITRMPRFRPSATSRSKSDSVPYMGSICS